jgi:hypothetical protein
MHNEWSVIEKALQLSGTSEEKLLQLNDMVKKHPYFELPYIYRAALTQNPSDVHAAAIMHTNHLQLKNLLSSFNSTAFAPHPTAEVEHQSTEQIEFATNAEPVAIPDQEIIEASNQAEEVIEPIESDRNYNLEAVHQSIEEEVEVNTQDAAAMVVQENIENALTIEQAIPETQLVDSEQQITESTVPAEETLLTAVEPSIAEPIAPPTPELEDGKPPAFKLAPPSPPANITVNEDELIPIQAYHTIDYFAALGIKASHKIEGEDKVSNQIRTFTQWLRTLKSINPNKLSEKDNYKIQKQAAKSIEPVLVLTESMAEVLNQQGMQQEAITIYEKLSLQEPQKSAYFAAKINELKK